MATSPTALPSESQKINTLGSPHVWLTLCLVLGGILLAFFDTTQSMVRLWIASDTFAHCFLVVPIVLWLVYQRRSLLTREQVRPTALPLLALLGVGLVWLIASLASIEVVQHLALVCVIVLSIWAVLGHRIAKILQFPLAFLFFAAPVGDELVPIMMDVTADFTVSAIQFIGIPVYREGLYFTLPSGNWSVVEACSGIRYLIASLMLGSLYANISYDSPWRRLAFMGLAILVPIVANGLRAFLIVVIGHYSDMTLATGVDHLIYGWLFFGIVMFVLFSLGALFQEPLQDNSGSISPIGKSSPIVLPAARLLPIAVLTLLLATLWPVYGGWLASGLQRPDANAVLTESLPEPLRSSIGGWQLTEASGDVPWQPDYTGFDSQLSLLARSANGSELHVYALTFRDGEVVAYRNSVVPRFRGDSPWHVRQSGRLQSAAHPEVPTVERTVFENGDDSLTVWTWSRINGTHVSDRYRGKLLEALSRLPLGIQPARTYFVVSTADPDEAHAAIEQFLGDVWSDVLMTEPAHVEENSW